MGQLSQIRTYVRKRQFAPVESFMRVCPASTCAFRSTEQMVLSTSTTIAGQSATTQSFTYNVDGQVESVSLNGSVMADPVYAAGLLTGVTYANGTALTNITRNTAGAGTGFTWDFATDDSVTDTVLRSQTGRIVQNTLTDGAVVET